MKPVYFFIAFFIALTLNCYFIYFPKETAQQITKALLMPLLITPIIISTSFKNNQPLIGVLILSWLGDLALLGKGQAFFMTGLCLFLCAHLGYVFIFTQIKSLRLLSTRKLLYSLLNPLSL